MKTSHALHRIPLLFASLVAMLATDLSTAADGNGFEESPDAIEVVPQIGWIGVFDSEAVDNFASVEARLGWNWHGIRPWAGMTVVDSGAWFAGGGFIYDIRLPRELRLTLGTGPFYYDGGEHGEHELGFEIEFYSFVEITRECRRGTRLGARLGHLSNAGLGRINPGTETFAIVAVIPIDRD